MNSFLGFGRTTLLVAVAAIFFAASGCGGGNPTGTVSGTVTFEGEPYEDAAVMFLSPTTGQAAGTDIESGGQFSLDEPLPVGTYNVYLAPKSVPVGAEPTPVSIDETVPQKYWNEASTDITVTVEEGENDVTIALERA